MCIRDRVTIVEVAILPTNNFATIKVIIKLKIPWISLSKVYLNIGTLCLLIKEFTWAIIDSPEKEHKKLIILSFNGIVNVELAIILQPLVISIPVSYTHLDVYKRQVINLDERKWRKCL